MVYDYMIMEPANSDKDAESDTNNEQNILSKKNSAYYHLAIICPWSSVCWKDYACLLSFSQLHNT